MAEAQVRGDVKNMENAGNALTDTTLYAPFSGYVDKQFVENHQMVADGQAILSFVDPSAVAVEAAFRENIVVNIYRFESYTCRFDACPDNTFSAHFK